MKVIEDKSRSFQYTCRNCYSVLEVDKEDILGDIEVGGNLHILCPCCKKRSEVLWMQIPQRVKDNL